MQLSLKFLIVICIGLTSCGKILINKEILSSEIYYPKVYHSYKFISQTTNGFLYNYDKDFYSKADSSFKCFRVLKKEKFDLFIDQNGAIKTQSKDPFFDYNGYSFYNGQPYRISVGEILGFTLNLTFYDANLKETKNYVFKFLPILQGDYYFSKNVKIKFITQNDYYFYGELTNGKSSKLFVARIVNNKIEDFAYSETSYPIKAFYEPKILPNGDFYFVALLSKDFGPATEDYIVRYRRFENDLEYITEIPKSYSEVGENPMMLINEELILLPNRINYSETKLPVYAVSTNDFKLVEKFITVNGQNKLKEVKVFDVNQQQFLGFINNLNEVKIYKVGSDLNLTQAFKVNDLANSFMVKENDKIKLFEIYTLALPNGEVKGIFKTHSDSNTFTEKILFEGVVKKVTCEN